MTVTIYCRSCRREHELEVRWTRGRRGMSLEWTEEEPCGNAYVIETDAKIELAENGDDD